MKIKDWRQGKLGNKERSGKEKKKEFKENWELKTGGEVDRND